jgi:HD-GYP domain-containing protein (c-di-GMP phosphodiesterase class II)
METARGFITTFMSAISNCSLYSKEHSSLDELAQHSLSYLEELMKDSDSYEIMIVDDDLILNKTLVREVGNHGKQFIKKLKRKGISRIDFLKGIKQSELRCLITDLASQEEELKKYPHIRSGVVDVRLGGLKIDADIDLNDLSNFTAAQVDTVKDVYQNWSPFKRLNIAGLEEIVVNFIITFKREANILKLISPVKTYSEYTYTHATNVAVLSMFQAEILGIKDTLLRDIGIAALLHDVGKLFVSKEILDKKAALKEEEWKEIKRHPYYGARYLSKIDSITRLAPVIAFEHHLKYDGTGYPENRINGNQQHIFSQVVAISDYFDALRSKRPYRASVDIKEVLTIMKTEANGVFNPVLLDSFIQGIHLAFSN